MSSSSPRAPPLGRVVFASSSRRSAGGRFVAFASEKRRRIGNALRRCDVERGGGGGNPRCEAKDESGKCNDNNAVASASVALFAFVVVSNATIGVVNKGDAAFAETKFLPIPETSVPATASCGNFTKERLDIARAILVCNQEPGTKNWKQACLSHYSANVEYTDGPGLTHVVGRENMRQYLKNQFDFSRQWLSVTDEVCDGNKYVAEWNLSMDLGIGSFRDLPGVTVLKFMEDGSDLVKYHRDYLPDGNIVERQPVVGSLVKFQRETYARCMASKEGCVGLLGGPGK